MSDDAVVVTGVGAVTPLGLGADASFRALVEGRSGIGRASAVLPLGLDARVTGEVRGFDAAACLDPKTAKHTARSVHLAVAAADEAVRAAGLAEARYPPARVGALVGVGFAGMETCYDAAMALATRGPSRVSPFALSMITTNGAPALVARRVGARGPSFAISSACASGTHAIGEALRLVRAGVVDAVVAGGSEACVHPLTLALFARMGALSVRACAPEAASRPFDRLRDGFVLAEGAGFVVLERAAAARARGAPVLAELAGYGATTEDHDAVLPEPDGRGMAEAMEAALADARIARVDVDHVNAHGTSTAVNDRVESLALRRVFGPHAPALWVSATKGATGHALGATGAMEAVFTVLALRDGVAPPTLNLDEPDPACDLDYVPRTARRGRLRVALTNSFAFFGQNAVLVLRRAELGP